eukprot:CAMPEP_0115832784 /NCGR_PEP_ID=MMETSP0287-20121206/2837_1 /TAXON_ID=412157 /ORGANISM="Chrysochromulina rotalis, Strain UIO044" /LENGTH=72 /DNA_ID=CAMNT_0003286181 /DNA_START=61 /DNA_END=280 /DNA_ORIENTATION=+
MGGASPQTALVNQRHLYTTATCAPAAKARRMFKLQVLGALGELEPVDPAATGDDEPFDHASSPPRAASGRVA